MLCQMDRSFQSQSDQNGLIGVLGSWSTGDGPLYRQLADALRTAVAHGDLPAGARLPPERALAQLLSVSRSTVVAAYEALRDEELLERRQGSGTRVQAQRRGGLNGGLNPAARTVPMPIRNALVRGLIDVPNATIDLVGAYLIAQGGLPSEVFDGLDQEIAELAQQRSGYSPLGYPALRCAIAEHLSAHGLQTLPEQVLVTSGAQQAIHLVAWLYVERGDTVVVENPTYPGALDAFGSLGAHVVGVSTRRNGVEIEQLRDVVSRLSPRLVYVIPSYQNPSGGLMPSGRRRLLADLVDEHQVALLEDESLSGLGLGDDGPPPVAAHASSSDAAILTVGSLSKLSWGGLRIGWVRAPEALIAQLGRLKAVHDLAGSMPSQVIGARVLGAYTSILRERRGILRDRYALITGLLERWLPGWTWEPPQGGLCLWVRLDRGNANEFAQVALRHGVQIVSGAVASADGSFADRIRLPFGQEPATLEEAIRRLAEAWQAYAPTVAPDRAASMSVVV